MEKAKLEKAARFLADKKIKGTVQMKIQYLEERQGFTFDEVLEAMNIATDGGLVRAALGGE